MKNMNKLLLVQLLMLLISTYSFSYELNGVYYRCYLNSIDGNTASVIQRPDGEKYKGDIVIASSFTDGGCTYTVTSISNMAFYFCTELTSLVMPNTIKKIEENAFIGCSNLKTMNISESTETIGKGAFDSCSEWDSIQLPSGLRTIGDGAFGNCRKANSIHIPKSVMTIGRGAFTGMINLSSLTVDVDNPYYDSRGNCNAIVETVSNKIIAGCAYTSIPNDVTSIADYAYRGFKNMTSLHIPSQIKEIGRLAFYACQGLKAITVAEDNEYYDSRNNCNALIETKSNTLLATSHNTVIPDDIVEIAYNAFNNCYNYEGYTSLVIPASVETIGENAFSSLNYLEEVYCYPEDPPSVMRSVFDYNRLKNMVLYVPKKSLNKYMTSYEWKDFMKVEAIPEVVESVNEDKVRNKIITSVYYVNGNSKHNSHKGIKILKYDDGTVQKSY